MLKWKIFFFPVHQSRNCNLMPINGFAKLSSFVFITRVNGGLSFFFYRERQRHLDVANSEHIYLLWRSSKGATAPVIIYKAFCILVMRKRLINLRKMVIFRGFHLMIYWMFAGYLLLKYNIQLLPQLHTYTYNIFLKKMN